MKSAKWRNSTSRPRAVSTCLSERQIEAETGIPNKTVDEWVREKRQVAEFAQPCAAAIASVPALKGG